METLDTIKIIEIILGLLSGIALFLFGMSIMGDGLKKVAGNKLEALLYKLTSNPLKGILLGAGVTAIIQSSSATSVMVVGFVNSGMMKVFQGIGIIMGANIGTSITGWILCLSDVEGAGGIATLLSSSSIAAIVAIIGILLRNLSKKESHRYLGDIMLGFSILMVGMSTMKTAMSPLQEIPSFTRAITHFSNPLLGILVGILSTAILQSASASVGILQSIAATSFLPFSAALPIIMGIGIGAAAPVLLSGMSSNKNGKRTAFVYLINDVFGMVIWASIFYITQAIIAPNGTFSFMNMKMTSVHIALLNTVYRILTILVLAPFIKQIEKLVFWLIKDDNTEEEDTADFELLEERFLAYPDLALAQSHKVLNGMARKAQRNLHRAIILTENYTPEAFQVIREKEAMLDKYEDRLAVYIMQITGRDLNQLQMQETTKLLHTISDFERIGDHASGISKVAKEMAENNLVFSEDGQYELSILHRAVEEIISITIECFEEDNMQLARQVEPLRQVIRSLCHKLKNHHIARLQGSVCNINQGIVFNDMLNNLDRVAAHCSNVAVAVIEQTVETEINPHEYLRTIRETNENHFVHDFDAFKEKYTLKK